MISNMRVHMTIFKSDWLRTPSYPLDLNSNISTHTSPRAKRLVDSHSNHALWSCNLDQILLFSLDQFLLPAVTLSLSSLGWWPQWDSHRSTWRRPVARLTALSWQEIEFDVIKIWLNFFSWITIPWNSAKLWWPSWYIQAQTWKESARTNTGKQLVVSSTSYDTQYHKNYYRQVECDFSKIAPGLSAESAQLALPSPAKSDIMPVQPDVYYACATLHGQPFDWILSMNSASVILSELRQ